ncbi:DUF4365 domain-containing protein [Runella sp.]|uniref:DUF4365 domain-containing protein n=1 Tax=Runella sp. TaxID=1960881 RepID=UPI003D11B61A
MPRFDNTERIGVTTVEGIFLRDFNWIPRTIFQSDVGIDMIVELTDAGVPNGRMIGVQIKSGESYFADKDSTGNVIFRCSDVHVNYWINYALPVIVVLHHVSQNHTIWEQVTSLTIVKTGKNYKLVVPMSNTLSVDKRRMLENIVPLAPAINRLQRFIFDSRIIRKLQQGGEISLEWAYTVSTKMSIIRILEATYIELEEENALNDYIMDMPPFEGEMMRFTTSKIKTFNDFYHFYPWAVIALDTRFYADFPSFEEDIFSDYPVDKKYEWDVDDLPGTVYSLEAGIIKRRYSLSLNHIGKIFIDFFDFLDGTKQLEIPF